jgi:hypothetical protein
MYKPWIGPNYNETRLLILGESAYSWPEDNARADPSVDHSTECAQWICDHFDMSRGFLTTLSRALANDYEPTPRQLRSAWNRVAFTNFVTGTVGGVGERPSPAMWAAAKKDFLPHLSEFFRSDPKPMPKRIIVIGKGMWEEMPDPDVRISDDVKGYRLEDQVVMCSGLPHTRAGLSWRQLASAIHFEMRAGINGAASVFEKLSSHQTMTQATIR